MVVFTENFICGVEYDVNVINIQLQENEKNPDIDQLVFTIQNKTGAKKSFYFFYNKTEKSKTTGELLSEKYFEIQSGNILNLLKVSVANIDVLNSKIEKAETFKSLYKSFFNKDIDWTKIIDFEKTFSYLCNKKLDSIDKVTNEEKYKFTDIFKAIDNTIATEEGKFIDDGTDIPF